MLKKQQPTPETVLLDATEDDDPDRDPRRRVPRAVWAVFVEAGELSDRKATQLFEDFLNGALRAWLEGNKTTRNEPVLLDAVQSIKTRLTSKALESIDMSVLARNNRVRGTGFDGVYHHRDAYVIDARDAETGQIKRMPGRYPEPAMAAWARYQHYVKHKIPYGKFEEEIEKVRRSIFARQEKWSEAYIRAQAIWSLAVDGAPPDTTFLKPGEDRWLTENPVLKMEMTRGEDEPDLLNARSDLWLLEPEPEQPMLAKPAQAALPSAPKQTIAQAQAEADKAREAALVSSREARAARMAAKHGVVLDDDLDDDDPDLTNDDD